jgi:hypothetical protein
MKALADQVAAMTEAQRAEIAARFPIVTIEAHAISARNACLVTLQAEGAVTIVGGFRQWLHHGRAVRKGEKALYILRPCAKRAPGAGQDSQDQDGPPQLRGQDVYFRLVPVFDVAQTDPLPEQVAA